MQDSAKLKVIFIAGFGPVVRDTRESRRLYRDVLGIPFKEEADGYLHTEAVPGAKTLLYGRFLKRPSLVLAKTPGPRTFLRLKLGLS